LFIRRLRKKEDNLRYKEKLSLINITRDDGFLIWFHVASVGEAMSILPLIESCIDDKKIDKILITSITLSSGKILEKKYKKNTKVTHQFLPLDVPIFVKKFLNHWKPNLSIFIDSEIWPNLILQTKKRDIPLLLLNARITEKSFNRWKLVLSFAKKIFGKFDLCVASNKQSEEFLKILGVKSIKNFGNLKFSQTKKKIDNKLDSIFLSKIKNRKVWCAASTHPDEEILCGKAHLNIKKKIQNVLTIIIPRHIDRSEKIKEKLLNLNLKVVFNSQLNELDTNTDILIVDSYGESLKFYDISNYVFVVKSLSKYLIKNSGQNPLEPAKLGCKIFHGPHVTNFTEIYDYLRILGVAKKISGFEELYLSLIEEFIKNKPKTEEISSKIEDYGQNIFNNVVVELKKYI
jgi:3-deoxy-D-manno-octulosonic-acid transferase